MRLRVSAKLPGNQSERTWQGGWGSASHGRPARDSEVKQVQSGDAWPGSVMVV